MTAVKAESDIDEFIARWTASSGNERANFHLFAVELCDILGVPRPQIAQENRNLNDYTFERTVKSSHISSVKATGGIDLYQKNSFLMEAKQSRQGLMHLGVGHCLPAKNFPGYPFHGRRFF